ncbi:MAG: penicillin-binding protein 2 [Candidatus Nitrospinota bacterium M3_3B_026]
MFRPRTESEIFFKRARRRVFFFTLLVSAGFLLVILRLWHLQVAQYATLSYRAENNRIREVTLDGLRGRIFDRNGRLLVDSRPSFQLALIPEDVDDTQDVLSFLGREINLDVEQALARIETSKPFQPVVLKRDISRKSVAFVEENRIDAPGVYLKVKPIRNYVHGDMASHFFGYLGAITRRQLEKAPPRAYSRDDFIGQYGIEKIFESSLRGTKGFKRVEVDAAGRELSQLGVIPPRSGADLRITLDFDAQAAAEAAFEGKMGAAVAIDPDTGDMLAFVSKPSFDPNAFASGIGPEKWSKLITSRFHPLQNRAIQGQYPPGSTFKIVVAAAALEEGIIDRKSRYFCPGHFRLGRRVYRCWKEGGHGWMNAHDALVQSCDVFFYNVGLKLGIDTIAKYARMFGFGHRTGIDLLGEKSGLIPTRRWKEKARGEPWILGETVSCSIGQGYVLATPVQQARMIAAVANGGRLITPRIALRTKGGDAAQGNVDRAGVSPETLGLIRRALLGVVYEQGGTAWRIKKGAYVYAGKTGTSQVVRMKHDEEKKELEEIKLKFRDHGWFVAFAPYDDPKIAVAVIAEHAGHGGEAAAPIARAIMDAYLSKIGAEKKDGYPVAMKKLRRGPVPPGEEAAKRPGDPGRERAENEAERGHDG